MTRNQSTDDQTPIVYEDDLDELARLMFNNPDHPRVKEIKRIAEKQEKEHLSERSN